MFGWLPQKNLDTNLGAQAFSKIPDNMLVLPVGEGQLGHYSCKGIYDKTFYNKLDGSQNYVGEDEFETVTEKDGLEIQKIVTQLFSSSSPHSNSYFGEDPRNYSVLGFYKDNGEGRYAIDYLLVITTQIDYHIEVTLREECCFVQLEAVDYFNYQIDIIEPKKWLLGYGTPGIENGQLSNKQKTEITNYCLTLWPKLVRYPNYEISEYSVLVFDRVNRLNKATLWFYLCRNDCVGSLIKNIKDTENIDIEKIYRFELSDFVA